LYFSEDQQAEILKEVRYLKEMLVGGVPKQQAPKRREDYPKVRFWTEKEYNNAKELGNISILPSPTNHSGSSKPILFLEDEKGSPMSIGISDYVRTVARGIFNGFLEKWIADNDKPIDSFMNLSLSYKEEFYRGIEKACPEVDYCEAKWKATKIGIRYYPDFVSSKKKKGEWPGHQNQKLSPSAVPVKRSVSEPPNKSSHEDAVGRESELQSKRMKTKTSKAGMPSS
jgi:hypothetical protein